MLRINTQFIAPGLPPDPIFIFIAKTIMKFADALVNPDIKAQIKPLNDEKILRDWLKNLKTENLPNPT